MPDLRVHALCPLDGRYREKVEEVAAFYNESNLFKTKLWIEAHWMNAVSEVIISEKADLDIIDYKTLIDRAVELEEKIGHDTKACELAVAELLQEKQLDRFVPFVHFGLTSEDVTGLAYALIFKSCWNQHHTVLGVKVLKRMRDLVVAHRGDAMLGMTHGQPASPTTFGKEIANFIMRLFRERLGQRHKGGIPVKLGGAVGNFSSFYAACSEVDWILVIGQFIQTVLGEDFEFDLFTTQIPNRDWMVDSLHNLHRINSILLDFTRDLWLYCSRSLLKLRIVQDEVGSSTMPHKVNPIHFENAEGNLEMANGMIETLSRKLPLSRMQRDLSDSTVMRNMGCVLGYTSLAWQSLLTGLERLQFNADAAKKELNDHWEILAEPVQMILRRIVVTEKVDVDNPYDMVKRLVRSGRSMKEADYRELVLTALSPKIPSHITDQLLDITPLSYVGQAEALCNRCIARCDDLLLTN